MTGETHCPHCGRKLLPLSPREALFTKFLLAGEPRSRIAKLMRISPKTADTYRQKIWQRSGARSVAELRIWAIEYGLDRENPNETTPGAQLLEILQTPGGQERGKAAGIC